MKKYFLPILVLITVSVFAQEEEIIIKGTIYAPDGSPVDNAYIINMRNLSVWTNRKDGQFTISAMPDDSMMVNHVSFLQKKIYINILKNNPDIFLEYDTIQIQEVIVSPGPDRDSMALQKTMESIKSYEFIIPRRIMVSSSFIESNSVLSSAASSISLITMSPSSTIKDLSRKIKLKSKRKGVNFYRNEKHKARKEKRKAGK